MSSNRQNQQLGALDFSEATFPNISKHFQNQKQRLSQNHNRVQQIVSVPSTIDVTLGREDSEQQADSSGGHGRSQTQSQLLTSEDITNVQKALVSQMGNERPRSFSQPNFFSSSQSRLQSLELSQIVQSQHRLIPKYFEDENRRLNNSIKEREKNSSSSLKKYKISGKTFETMQRKFSSIVPERVKNLKDIPTLSKDQRFCQESQGKNLPKKQFKRFERFKTANYKKMLLETRYSKLRPSTRLSQVRLDKTKRGQEQSLMYEDKTQRSQQMNKMNYVYLNIDMLPLKNARQHDLKKVYQGENQETRRLKVKLYLQKQIKRGRTFIFLVEAYTKEIRRIIREVVQTTRTKKGQFYYYPEHLDQDCDLYATIILSKIKVRFGRMKYSWPALKLPEQSFCEFEVLSLDEKTVQTFCLFCCHWKSNRNQTDQRLDQNRNIRQYQKECCYDLYRARRYDTILLIGDTNLEDQDTLQNDPRFTDTYFQSKEENINFAPPDQRINKYKGNYLLVDKNCKVNQVRPGRVLVNKESQDRVRVKTKIDDFFLDNCEHLKKNEKRILISQRWLKLLHYIRPSDHMFLKGSIYI